VGGILQEIKTCLDGDMPESGRACDYCAYWNSRKEFEK
jgi:hypothetical protein